MLTRARRQVTLLAAAFSSCKDAESAVFGAQLSSIETSAAIRHAAALIAYELQSNKRLVKQLDKKWAAHAELLLQASDQPAAETANA